MGLTNAIDQQQDRSQADLLANAQGVIAQPFSPLVCTQFNAPNTQVVFGVSVYVPAGSLVTGIKLRNAVAAAGTSPTTARFGVTDASGKVLAVSANLNAAASWPAGVITAPFTAPLTLASAGVYFLIFVVNGVWGTTQPTPAATTGTGGFSAADGTHPAPSFNWNGQTDLPAVGASVVLAATGRTYWTAIY